MCNLSDNSSGYSLKPVLVHLDATIQSFNQLHLWGFITFVMVYESIKNTHKHS